MSVLDRLNAYDSPKRTEPAPLWLALVSWLVSRPASLFDKAMRWHPFDIRYRLNMARNWCWAMGRAYHSRYPLWASEVGYSCGCRTPEGKRCHVQGMGHPGPHRVNPDGPLPVLDYRDYHAR